MRLSTSGRSWPSVLLLSTCCTLLALSSSAVNLLRSTSLESCMAHNHFTASFFDVIFMPHNRSLSANIKGYSGISGKVLFNLEILAYGYPAFSQAWDPCDNMKLFGGFCPMTAAPFALPFNHIVPKEALKYIPTPVYYIPDLDVRARIRATDLDHHTVGCVETELANDRTVRQEAVAWVVATLALLGLAISALASGLGHTNAGAHLLSNSLSLFSYYQALAFVGMTSVTTSPIVRAWTQNFQWSAGIMHLAFLQQMATWYQRATGGKPATLISSLNHVSVHVQKRTNALEPYSDMKTSIPVRGMERVGFQSQIEKTNIFLTTYTFFIIFLLFTVISTLLAKTGAHLLVRLGWVDGEKFVGPRKEWKVVMKGNLMLMVLIAFPPMITLSLWQLFTRDSAGELVIAVHNLTLLLSLITYAFIHIIGIGRRSIELHKTPAYALYSNAATLQQWAAFYIPFRASWYFYAVFTLLITLTKSFFIAFAQGSGTTQAVAFLVLSVIHLVLLAVIRPYMNKKTNAFNIAIACMDFGNSAMLLLFAHDIHLRPLGIGVLGVIFFAINAVFLIIMLGLVIANMLWAMLSANPDERYGNIRDDRNSFIRSKRSLQPHPELEELGITARSGSRGSTLPPVTTQSRTGLDGIAEMDEDAVEPKVRTIELDEVEQSSGSNDGNSRQESSEDEARGKSLDITDRSEAHEVKRTSSF